MTNEPLLHIENLVVSFENENGLTTAVDKLSLDLYQGQTLAIVGESGSGKSVTVMNILQLLPQPPAHIEKGKIIFHNQDLLQTSKEEMRKVRGAKIAMIFQEPMTSLNPVYTCGDQVMEMLVEHQNIEKTDAKTKVIQLFEKVKIPRPEIIFDSYPFQLSGGQKQRVVIAMAMICNPEIIIADEPTTALDVTVQKEILSLLKSLQKEFNMGLIFITHDLGVVKEIADQVLVMFQGKVVEYNTAKNIFNHPQHSYTKGLINCRPPRNSRPKKLLTISDFLNTNQPKINFETKEERQKRHQLLYSKPPVIEVTKLTKKYSTKSSFFSKNTSEVIAVNEVSFNLYSGETLGLVGESGCGKTTLSRTILGLIKPTSGTIKFEGKFIENLSTQQFRPLRKDLQIIFQDPYSSLNPKIKIGDAILEPMKIHDLYKNDNIRKEKVIDLLEKTGLKSDHYNRYPHEFSGGQRQRIVIARTLSLNPKIIVCDEVVSALDVSVQAQVLNLMNDLKREFNLTYLFISHDLSIVKFMSDRIMVMNKGRIEEINEADSLFFEPKSTYTKKLIDSIPGV